MSKLGLNMRAGSELFYDTIANPSKAPFTFKYGNELFVGLQGNVITSKRENETIVFITHEQMLDQNVKVTYECKFCKEFAQSEYVVWIENVGDKPSEVVSDFKSISLKFEGKQPILRGILGDHVNYYTPYETDLTEKSVNFVGDTGRATHVNFPYFNLVHGDGGTLIAVGWAGTWTADFKSTESGAELIANNCNNLNAVLLPGEKIRSALVVLMPYSSREEHIATNLWREWFMKYNLPKANACGDDLKPFTTAFFAYDTGLPNSDGSISERHFTWKRSLDKILSEAIYPDFRWFDAGWYTSPSNQSVQTDWWGEVGTWTLDHEKWPDKTFRESVDYFHDKGIKTLVWFEPERVTHLDDLIKNHGYKDEWAICTAGNRDRGPISNNIGIPDCFNWTLDRILKMMKENDVDFFREDNNSDPMKAWAIIDKEESEKYGVLRKGLSENKMICAHYALWDAIIEFCKNTNKCTFVDSCASGGGRNDIESLRRGFPLMRSDRDRAYVGTRLSQTHSFCKWIPFHGASTKETTDELSASSDQGPTNYVFRASYLPIMSLLEGWTVNKNLDYNLLRKNLAEWHEVKHLLTKDYYTLTPWPHESDLSGWVAFAYDDPAIGESLLLAFRQEHCPTESFTAQLPFVIDEQIYTLKNVDTDECYEATGKELKKGINITLSKPKSSAMIRIFKK